MRRGAVLMWVSFVLIGVVSGIVARVLSNAWQWQWFIACPVAFAITVVGFVAALYLLSKLGI